MNTIYYLPPYGQLGNQLTILAHLLAFSKAYNYNIVFPYSKILFGTLNFEKDMGTLTFSKEFGKKKFSYITIMIIKLMCFKKNVRIGKILIINNIFNAEELDVSDLPKTIVLTNWLFRFKKGIHEHQDLLREHLSFRKGYLAKINVNNIIEPPHVSIAVHVRRGDYAQWENGKYFFEISQYYESMVNISKQIQHPKFLVFSNEPVSFPNELGLYIQYVKGNAIEDIYLMAKCDYIIGPPSTFSGWASFLGNKPIYFIEDPNKNFLMKNFTTNFL